MDCTVLPDITLRLPPAALDALRALEDAGFEAWAVGGCVRDGLLGRHTEDIDIATSALWEQSESVLGAAGFCVHRTGTKHGTVTASRSDGLVEVTTFRNDGPYRDGRHPQSVEFVGSLEEDLARRDFTINALAYHPNRGLVDCFGGWEDLEAGILRAIGDPDARFQEDGLRILRGFRFVSQLDFSLESETLQAMKAQKMMLQAVSAERIVHEMDRLLLGDAVFEALMGAIDVLGAVMPEVVACKGFDQHTPYHIYDIWEHTARAVSYAPKTRLARWVAFYHDLGKPGAFFMEGERGHFYGHGKLSVMIAREIMERLKFAPAFRDRVCTLIAIHDRQIEPTAKSVKRALGKLGGDVELFRTLLGIKRADALAQSDLSRPRLEALDALEGILDDLLAANEAFCIKQLAVSGRDLLDIAGGEGPEVGRLLNELLDEVIEGKLPNERAALLDFARRNGSSQTGDGLDD